MIHKIKKNISDTKRSSKIIKCEKSKYIQAIVRDAEHSYTSHRLRDLYRKKIALNKDFKPNEKFLIEEDKTTNE